MVCIVYVPENSGQIGFGFSPQRVSIDRYTQRGREILEHIFNFCKNFENIYSIIYHIIIYTDCY